MDGQHWSEVAGTDMSESPITVRRRFAIPEQCKHTSGGLSQRVVCKPVAVMDSKANHGTDVEGRQTTEGSCSLC